MDTLNDFSLYSLIFCYFTVATAHILRGSTNTSNRPKDFKDFIKSILKSGQKCNERQNQLFIDAFEAQEDSDCDRATELYQQLLQEFPQNPVINYNLNIIYQDC